MASDLIQNQYARKTTPNAKTRGNRLELTREQSFLDGQHDIFDILARHQNDGARLNQNLGTTAQFLERTRVMLHSAEQKVCEQDQQLKTLQGSSETDPLTGLLNRKGFSRALLREVARTNRGYNEGGLMVMFSLENFAKIHSTHGEKAAEHAVTLIANALESEMRDMDLAARTADDEFILLFTDTTMDIALGRLQNMALRLNRLSLVWNEEEIRLNLSLGLKSYQKGDRADAIFQDASNDLNRNRKHSSEVKSA